VKPLPEQVQLPLTVGTAGHIDHGKTALVQMLTGCDTDRLAEEQRRGMSIELGFTDLDLGGRCLSLVDVPGHERFVRTMIAGASGVDMFLLVVAADDGPMPQTLEHLAVLHALGVELGVIALTKVDLVDAETRHLVAGDAATLANGLPLVEVSPRTGEGLETLRAALAGVASTAEAERRQAGAVDEQPVLHVDRVFTVVGHGTVVTGTLWSGQLQRGQRVTLLPDEREARVRSIQIHDRPLDTADSHQRVALNLAGVARDEVQRGDVIAIPEAGINVTYRLDVQLLVGAEEILAEPRVQVHLGTRDSPARVADLTEDRAQLRLGRPLLARTGDRVVVRRIAPPDTLGGGVVLDPAAPRHGPRWEQPAETVGSSSASPPLAPAEPDAFAHQVLAALQADGPKPRGAAQLAGELGAERRQVEDAFGDLAAAGEVVRAKSDVVYAVRTYHELAREIVARAERDGSTSIAEVRDALGLSRKYARALLEQLDSEHRLHREGDRHLPRQKNPG
jgi:selenocysteine-specific elongation factor